MKHIFKKIQKDYFKFDSDLILWHQILTFCTNRFNDRLTEGENAKIKIDETYMNAAAILLPKIIEELKCDKLDFKNQFSVLVNNKELIYKQGIGIMVGDAGFVSFNDKKYLRQAEDILWKRRERIFNFVSKPTLLIISIVSVLFSISVYYKNISVKEDLLKIESKVKSLEASFFQLDNSTKR